MFTLNDICNIAIQIERNGEAAYRQAAKKAAAPEIATLLNRMADEEQRHGRWFEALSIEHAKTTGHQEVEAEVEEMGRALLQDMVKNQTFSLDSSSLAKSDQMAAVVKQATVFEKDTITFYEMMLDFVDDASVQEQLGMVIEEERQHIVQLSRLSEVTLD